MLDGVWLLFAEGGNGPGTPPGAYDTLFWILGCIAAFLLATQALISIINGARKWFAPPEYERMNATRGDMEHLRTRSDNEREKLRSDFAAQSAKAEADREKVRSELKAEINEKLSSLATKQEVQHVENTCTNEIRRLEAQTNKNEEYSRDRLHKLSGQIQPMALKIGRVELLVSMIAKKLDIESVIDGETETVNED